jgi:hypothetical protein
MLTAIPSYPALAGWRTRGAGDLGVMLLEAWASVLDTTGFYDARIAERCFLPTAPDAAVARRMAALIGHRPRPAMAARVQLALEADGADPVMLPKGTAFRSQPFNGEPPQVFELVAGQVIWPERNRWRLAPVRDDVFDGTLRFAPRSAVPGAGMVVTLWNDTHAAAARVMGVEPEPAPDGVTYQRVMVEAGSAHGIDTLTGQPLSSLNVAILRLPLTESRIVGAPSGSTLTLDGANPQVRAGDRAVVEIDAVLYPVTITSVARVMQSRGPVQLSTVVNTSGSATAQTFETQVTTPVLVTQLTLDPVPGWITGARLALYVDPFVLGTPSRPAKTEITMADIRTGGMLMPPVVLGSAPASGAMILQGARKEGVQASGMVIAQTDGVAWLQPDTGTASVGASLVAPVTVYGNVVEAVRGETVTDEVLGSGNAAVAHNSFTLKKKPLTWVEDFSKPGGRRPELSLRVDNVQWDWVDSFFGRRPDERIFTINVDADGAARITFGDGVRGARATTGVDNIRADYRFGAGAAKPPPGSINQIAVPVRGLAAVRGPVFPAGGADAETVAELQTSATASALTLGRAVSLADFEALARSYAGVVNASSAWVWDERRQRAAVKIWIVASGGDPSADLALWLAAQSASDLIVVAVQAGAAPFSTLSITLGVATAHNPESVRAAARAALFDPEAGLLAPRNQRIGGVLFRSALVHRLHQVPGIASVVSVLLDGLAMPYAVGAGQGNWFNLESGTTVS